MLNYLLILYNFVSEYKNYLFIVLVYYFMLNILLIMKLNEYFNLLIEIMLIYSSILVDLCCLIVNSCGLIDYGMIIFHFVIFLYQIRIYCNLIVIYYNLIVIYYNLIDIYLDSVINHFIYSFYL